MISKLCIGTLFLLLSFAQSGNAIRLSNDFFGKVDVSIEEQAK
jgi:hypothetical protein